MSQEQERFMHQSMATDNLTNETPITVNIFINQINDTGLRSHILVSPSATGPGIISAAEKDFIAQQAGSFHKQPV